MLNLYMVYPPIYISLVLDRVKPRYFKMLPNFKRDSNKNRPSPVTGRSDLMLCRCLFRLVAASFLE